MAEISIREASEADLPEMLRVYQESGIGGGQSFSVEEAREQLNRIRAYPSYRVFVALWDGKLAGTYGLIVLDKLAKRGARCGVVEDVAVLPEHQGRGIGKAMMSHAREQCRLAGCYKLALSSGMPRDGAHRFYESLGFERHGYSFVIRP